MEEQAAKRFAALFPGLNRARGIWHPKNGSMETTKEEILLEHFTMHLEGKIGLGRVPINDESQVKWGAIDIDWHDRPELDTNEKLDAEVEAITVKVAEHNFPLIACRSKSKGCHLYLFLKEHQPADFIQRTLQGWATKLGHPGIEVFPKQKKLAPGQVGNWINLPYYNVDGGTSRYSFHSGKILSFTEFMDLAEKTAATREQVVESNRTDPNFEHAPPCVQYALTQGIELGNRNNMIFTVGTYLKKTGVDDLEDQLAVINFDRNIMSKPLPARELSKITGSLLKSTFNYRCNEPPMCNHCDKDVCKTRKFGVGQDGPTKVYDDVMWGKFTKILSDPPKYEFEVNSIPVEFTSAQLMNFIEVQRVIFERCNLIIPDLKKEDWKQILRVKSEQRQEVEAPDDAGPGAIVHAMLIDFTRGAEKYDAHGEPIYGERREILRGRPVLIQDPKTSLPMIYFRGSDFISYLKRKKSEEAKGANLWQLVRKICLHDKIRIGGSVVQVWMKMPEEREEAVPVEKPKEKF